MALKQGSEPEVNHVHSITGIALCILLVVPNWPYYKGTSMKWVDDDLVDKYWEEEAEKEKKDKDNGDGDGDKGKGEKKGEKKEEKGKASEKDKKKRKG